MGIHVVKLGENLSRIAQHYGVRYWANIYLAGENDDLRSKRSNPNLICPGDKVVIPSKGSIARLETRAEVNYVLPKLFTQSTIDLCWQACAEMVYCWKYQTGNAEEEFKRKLGADYNKPGGLNMADRKTVLSKLGMTWAGVASVNELHEILAVRGPLFVAETNGNVHAQVLTGYNLMTVEWYLLDPLGKGMRIDFNTSGAVTGGSIGQATLANMSRKRPINSMVLDPLMFGYR
jgi:hypothetical protein